MRVQPEWMETNKAYSTVVDRLWESGFTAFAVGGCVRDAVMGVPCADVDVATSARPHDLPKVFGMSGMYDGEDKVFRNGDVALYPTGVSHGTWTVRVGDDEVELTTYRRDVDTDGRRATVEFADHFDEDAERRDFTMNALYMDRRGFVLDPTAQGLEDLRNGIVRFVGDAEERVREDYLRILRLFRFHARFGRGPMDADALAAAAKYKRQWKDHVSGERVWEEVKKLLSTERPLEALIDMDVSGVFGAVFGHGLMPLMQVVCQHERKVGLKPNWVYRYALGLWAAEIPYPASNHERQRVAAVHAAFERATPVWNHELAALVNEFGEEAGVGATLWAGKRYDVKEIRRGLEAKCPVSAKDFMDRGVKPGKELGRLVSDAKTYWQDSNLLLTKQEVLDKTLADGYAA